MEKQLDKNWSITSDDHSWKLMHNYTREVEEKVKDEKTKKIVKTGRMVEREFSENWWFPKISLCISKYQEEVLKPLGTLEEVTSKLSNIEALLQELKNSKFDTFKRC